MPDYYWGHRFETIDNYVQGYINPNVSVRDHLNELLNAEQLAFRRMAVNEAGDSLFWGSGAYGVYDHIFSEIINTFRIGDLYYAVVEDGINRNTFVESPRYEPVPCCRSLITLTRNANGNFNIVSKQPYVEGQDIPAP
jgi:hypothetical protein